MCIKTLFLALALAFLLSVANAAAIPSVALQSVVPRSVAPQSVNPAEEVKAVLVKRNEFCDDSSFQNKSTPASPWVDDCLYIARWMRGNPKMYILWYQKEGYQELFRYKTCVFAASSVFNRKVFIGNNDIGDLMFDSVRMFSWAHKVGAEGYVSCKVYEDRPTGTNPYLEARWAIYHT